MKTAVHYIAILNLFLTIFAGLGCSAKIDRKSLVGRHNVVVEKTCKNPAQVGNGEFAYNFDITGMQTFVPFNTMSHWGWYCAPMPACMKSPDDFKGFPFKSKGKTAMLQAMRIQPSLQPLWRRDFPDFQLSPEQKQIAQWMAANPSALNLGRIGLDMRSKGGKPASEADLTNAKQVLDLYTGSAKSSFDFDGKNFAITTFCRQSDDTAVFEISSPELADGKTKIFFEFPAPDGKAYAFYIGDYKKTEANASNLTLSKNRAVIERDLGTSKYFVLIEWVGDAEFSRSADKPNRFELAPRGGNIKLFANFSKDGKVAGNFDFGKSKAESDGVWKNYWHSGAAVDFSQTADPRAKELERRTVLSQYLMRINSAGSLPPQESGLLSNSWYGKFHYEMIWWHTVHFALWGRGELVQKQWRVFADNLETAKKRAATEGFRGAKWSKATGNMPHEWPHIIHATLLWQQPHPIYYAELEYRNNPSRATLEKWRDVVFETAEFLASYPEYDKSADRYNMQPPMSLVSENTNVLTTKNPTFELSYWRYGLAVALEWKSRLGEKKPAEWRTVLEKLAPLPVKDGVYETYEGIQEMWTKYAFEHPAIIGVYGMLRGDGANPKTVAATLAKIKKCWNFDRVWGWDFPMLAMAAARTGDANGAVEFLTTDSKQFGFDEHGVARGGPCPYFPSNGGVLAAVAMLAGGWDAMPADAFGKKSLAFPKNWKVKAEGFGKYQ